MTYDNEVLEVMEDLSSGYHPLVRYESWLVAVLNQGDDNDSLQDVEYLEYHAETDEVFILLKGEASLLVSGGREKPEDIKKVDMQPLKCYNVKKGAWHSIIFADGGSVAIVENNGTSAKNSVYYHLSEDEKKELIKLNERR